MSKALVAMSGGVDSSVAAALLVEQGYEVVGVTMKLYDNEGVYVNPEKSCCSLDDIEDAREVAFKLDFPYYVYNFKADFKEKVIDKFVNSYRRGWTPNPCIDCNRYLKFDELLERAKVLGCDYIVTGHYARIKFDEKANLYRLFKGADAGKDQSYVLYNLTQEQLSKTMFPLGEYTKDSIREIAESKGLINANKHDSQDICFVPDGKYADFIEKYTGKKVGYGQFVDEEGNVLGTHHGFYRYTIGQRRGLNISSDRPLYVKDIIPAKNRVVLSSNEALFENGLIAEDFNWIGEVYKELRCKARIRYHHKEADATVNLLENGKVKVIFDEPQRAITKGQSVVLYRDDEVLGGGTITDKVKA